MVSALEFIDNVTSGLVDALDPSIGMEISDRINHNPSEYLIPTFRCTVAIKRLIEILNGKKSRRILPALDIIEICSKNGNEEFHRKICTKKFMEAMLKHLKTVIFY